MFITCNHVYASFSSMFITCYHVYASFQNDIKMLFCFLSNVTFGYFTVVVSTRVPIV